MGPRTECLLLVALLKSRPVTQFLSGVESLVLGFHCASDESHDVFLQLGDDSVCPNGSELVLWREALLGDLGCHLIPLRLVPFL